MYFHPVRTEKINENVFVINSVIVNFYIYTNGKDSICFDCGTSGISARRGLEKVNINPESILAVFLTHSDYDHVGGLSPFKNAAVFLSQKEEEMINGKTPRLFLIKHNKIKRKDYKLLNDDETIMIGNIKVKAISTPGHTKGSMSYLVDDKILIIGDTLLVRKGRIIPFNTIQNMDSKTQIKSIEKIKRINGVEMICTGHSGYLITSKRV